MSTVPSLLSRTSSTSASLRDCTPRPPAKMTSAIEWPRTASGDCSPSAQSTASVTLDLPEPLGPTITLTPSPNSRRVRSGNDLKPLIVIDFRCTLAVRFLRLAGHEPVERVARRVLLGQLLAATRAVRDRLLRHHRRDREDAVVRGPGLLGDVVGHGRTVAGEALLQSRFEVDGIVERILDLLRKGLDDGGRGALEAGGQVAGPDHRLEHRRQHTLGLDHRCGRRE